jgi:hypothetical protein
LPWDTQAARRFEIGPSATCAVVEFCSSLFFNLSINESELAAAIARIEAKRDELAALPAQRERPNVLAMLPKAAAAYLKQVDAFAAGDAMAT